MLARRDISIGKHYVPSILSGLADDLTPLLSFMPLAPSTPPEPSPAYSNQGVEETKSSYNDSAVAGTGPNGGGGSASGIADQVHYSLSDVRRPILSL